MFDPVQAHFDLADRLAHDSYFAQIPVVTEYPRVQAPGAFAVNKIEQLTAVLRGKGAGFLVMLPHLSTSSERTNSPGPTMTVKFSGLAFTNEIIISSSQGLQIRTTGIIDRARKLWHQFTALRSYNTLGIVDIAPERMQGVPKELADDLRQMGFYAWGLEAVCLLSLDREAQSVMPSITPSKGSVSQTVTLAGTYGAAIWYTTDGTYPGAANGLQAANGTLYTTPITITSPCTIRAVAYEANKLASDLNAAEFTA